MLTVNILHVLVFNEHAILVLLELLFEGFHQYGQFSVSLISFVHTSFVEQRLVFWSNLQVLGSTCGSHASNQYQHVLVYLHTCILIYLYIVAYISIYLHNYIISYLHTRILEYCILGFVPTWILTTYILAHLHTCILHT